MQPTVYTSVWSLLYIIIYCCVRITYMEITALDIHIFTKLAPKIITYTVTELHVFFHTLWVWSLVHHTHLTVITP